MTSIPRYWAVVPAAGIGRRMGGQIPKQYLPLAGRLVIEHTLERLLQHPQINTVVVAVGAADVWWSNTSFANNHSVLRVAGGTERCHSVRNALAALGNLADEHDWVLVHDAVRPCLQQDDLNRLLQVLNNDQVGGLLGVPVQDTMKRIDAKRNVLATVRRENLWHAYTPQMFRLGLLREAMDQSVNRQLQVTDEAEAMELAGHRPILVEGNRYNLKITSPEDLTLAEFFLTRYN